MCFKDQAGARRLAAQQEAQRQDALAAREREQLRIAAQKKDTIQQALSARTVRSFSGQGGSGRRSLFQSASGGSGVLDRFNL